MKTTLVATMIAALLASSAVPAMAQVSVGVDAGAGVTVDAPAVDAQVGVDANANAGAETADNTFGSVMASIAGSANLDLSAVTDEANVSIVLLSSLEGNAESEAAALDQALAADAAATAALQANIDGNATIKAKLEADGYATSDVVAVKSAVDGSVIVYVDDRA